MKDICILVSNDKVNEEAIGIVEAPSIVHSSYQMRSIQSIPFSSHPPCPFKQNKQNEQGHR